MSSSNNKSKDFDPWLEEVVGNKYIENTSYSSLGTHHNSSDKGNENIKRGNSKKRFFARSRFLFVSTSLLFTVVAFFIFYIIHFGEKEQSKFKKVSAAFTNYELSENLKTSIKPSPSSKESPKASSSPSKSPTNKNIVYMNMDKVLGYSESTLTNVFDKPSRKDINEYGGSQFVYKDNNYSKFAMIGVNSGKCTSLYTNSKSYSLYNTLKIGDSKAACEQKLSSIGYLKKSNDIWFNQDTEFKAFYDQFNDNKLTAILMSKKTITRPSTLSKNSVNAGLCESMETELFDLVNAIRIRNGLPTLTWDSKAHIAARNHSIDMANTNFFSHVNKNDQDPFMRMKSFGITFSSASENIAAGQQSSVFAFESLMNSSGHRKNILDNYTRLGTGVAVGKGDYSIYYTQNFYSPM